MKNIDYFFFIIIPIAMLLTIDIQQTFKNRELQTQIDELKIIVDQRFLPAMILEQPNVR
jgi:hypothetical protein